MFNRIRSIRKRWIVAAATAALLAVGLASGAVFAASGPGQGAFNGFRYGHDYDKGGNHLRNGVKADVMTRVAEIIGVEQDTLESAFQTAFDEQAETGFDDRIDALVADETLTEDEGNAAQTWFEDRPALSGPLALRLSRTSDTQRVNNWLERLVDAEKLAPEPADALSAWHGERPDFLPEARGKRSKHHRGHHDGDDAGDGNGG